MALEYNFFIPLFFGPWHIYPFFRKDRETHGLNWTVLEIFKAFGKIFAMGCFIELYLHCFPFITVGFDKQDWLTEWKKGVVLLLNWILRFMCGVRVELSSPQEHLKLEFYQTNRHFNYKILNIFSFIFIIFNLSQAISKLSLTSIAGIIRAAIENFCFKYIVFYGIGSTWSKMVGISCPGGPSNHLFE